MRQRIIRTDPRPLQGSFRKPSLLASDASEHRMVPPHSSQPHRHPPIAVILGLLASLLLCLLATVALRVVTAPPSAAAATTLTEFPVPTAGSQLTSIAPGPDGALWFTERQGNKIGRITTTGQITEFPLPTANAQPYGIAPGPDGNVWFTELGVNAVGKINPGTQVITEYTLPGGPGVFKVPFGITAGPDGALWFTEEGGNAIGRIDTSGSVQEFFGLFVPPGSSTSAPDAITTGPDGNLWFTELFGRQVGQMSPSGVLLHEYPYDTRGPTLSAFSPSGIVRGPDGNVWFTDPTSDSLFRVVPATGAITLYQRPDGSQPEGITIGIDGALWFSETGRGTTSSNIGRITTAGVISECNCLSFSSGPAGIVTGSDGALWFVEVFANSIGRLSLGDTTPPTLVLPGPLSVDATSPAGALVSYSVTATDPDNPPASLTIACTPASGSTFPIGTTMVQCTASDPVGNRADGSFQVAVKGAVDQLNDLIALVMSFDLKQGITTSLDAKLQSVQDALTAANAGNRQDACNALGAFINEAQAQSGNALTTSQSSQLIAAALQIQVVLGC